MLVVLVGLHLVSVVSCSNVLLPASEFTNRRSLPTVVIDRARSIAAVIDRGRSIATVIDDRAITTVIDRSITAVIDGTGSVAAVIDRARSISAVIARAGSISAVIGRLVNISGVIGRVSGISTVIVTSAISAAVVSCGNCARRNGSAARNRMTIVSATIIAASVASAIDAGTAHDMAAANCSPHIGVGRGGGEHEQCQDAKDRFHENLLDLGSS
jgi:hypothetical protein